MTFTLCIVVNTYILIVTVVDVYLSQHTHSFKSFFFSNMLFMWGIVVFYVYTDLITCASNVASEQHINDLIEQNQDGVPLVN